MSPLYSHRLGPWLRLIFAGVLLLLAGCQSAPSRAVLTLVQGVTPPRVAPPTVVPGIRYLRVETSDSLAYMVLGDLDPSPLGVSTEVWYNPSRQVLRLNQGRIAGATGTPLEWSGVYWPQGLPSWRAAQAAPQMFTRLRDEMPGYRFSISERLTLRRAEAPVGMALPGVPAEQMSAWSWFTESAEPSVGIALPPAWFAVDLQPGGDRVMYSFQCLSAQLCLRLQPWQPGGNVQ